MSSSNPSSLLNWKGMFSWFSERFPLANFFASFVLFCVILAYVTQYLNFSPAFGAKEFMAGVAVVSQMLLLRILDEFKDFEDDQQLHPDRVLQKGMVNLKQLGVLGLFCVLFQVVFNGIYSSVLNPYWAVMFIWTFLMYKEFFVKDWLRKKSFVYLASHMTVIPLMVFWVSSLYLSDVSKSASIAGLILLGAILFELTRKTRGADENSSLESYSKKIGFLPHSFLLSFLCVGIFALEIFIINSLMELPVGYLSLVVAACALLYIFTVWKMYKVKTAKNRKVLEGAYALFMLSVYSYFIFTSYSYTIS